MHLSKLWTALIMATFSLPFPLMAQINALDKDLVDWANTFHAQVQEFNGLAASLSQINPQEASVKCRQFVIKWGNSQTRLEKIATDRGTPEDHAKEALLKEVKNIREAADFMGSRVTSSSISPQDLERMKNYGALASVLHKQSTELLLPISSGTVQAKAVLAERIDLSEQLAQADAAFASGKLNPEGYRAQLRDVLKKNSDLISRLDQAIIDTSPEQQAFLIQTRKSMVDRDKEVRSRYASADKANLREKNYPEETAVLLKTTTAMLPGYLSLMSDHRKGKITDQEYARVLESQFLSKINSLTAYLEERKKQLTNNPKYLRLVGEELRVCAHFRDSIQAAIRFSKSHNLEELNAQSRGLKEAGLILQGLDALVDPSMVGSSKASGSGPWVPSSRRPAGQNRLNSEPVSIKRRLSLTQDSL